jgi:DNA-binding PadR family transcriptional regulator
LILKLYEENREVVKTSLLPIVPNSYSLERYLRELAANGLISIREEKIVRKTFYVSLTLKGRAVAEQLKRVDGAVRGRSMEAEPFITMETNEKGEKIYVLTPNYREFAEERRKRLSALIHVNVLDDHIVFKETNYEGTGKDRLVVIYVKLNGNGILRLWCELDESYDCWHVSEAWSLPAVREMYFNQVKKGNIKG